MPTTVMKAATRVIPRWSATDLKRARVEIAALQPGHTWDAGFPITIDEFSRLTPEDTQAELFEGVIFLASPTRYHEAVFMFLATLLNGYVVAKRLGEVLGSRSGVRLDDFSAPQPDLLFVRKKRRAIIKDLLIMGAPDLIIEIVSSDRGRQRALAKMLRYASLGVPEFWLVDVHEQRLFVSKLDNNGQYQATFDGDAGLVRSKVVNGFALKTEWLWSVPGKFPDTLVILQELLAGRVPR